MLRHGAPERLRWCVLKKRNEFPRIPVSRREVLLMQYRNSGLKGFVDSKVHCAPPPHSHPPYSVAVQNASNELGVLCKFEFGNMRNRRE